MTTDLLYGMNVRGQLQTLRVLSNAARGVPGIIEPLKMKYLRGASWEDQMYNAPGALLAMDLEFHERILVCATLDYAMVHHRNLGRLIQVIETFINDHGISATGSLSEQIPVWKQAMQRSDLALVCWGWYNDSFDWLHYDWKRSDHFYLFETWYS